MGVDHAALRTLVASKLAVRGAEAAPLEPAPAPTGDGPPAVWSLLQVRRGYGPTFVDDRARRAVEVSLRDGTFLQLQLRWSRTESAPDWRDALGALDRPERWIEIGLREERSGRILDANAAFAAARWLDPDAGGEVVERVMAERPDPLPERVMDQPHPRFRELALGKRHWTAWSFGKSAQLHVPSLLAHETDPNFWVRTRIYRSIAQTGSFAGMQALHEGTFDPHPFARAQAVRSLGWMHDPTISVRLEHLSASDPDREVRRTASLALERIQAHWLYFGEWSAIEKSVESVFDAAYRLRRAGMPSAAFELVDSVDLELGNERLGDLRNELHRHASEHDRADPRSRYYAWAGDAAEAERAPSPVPALEDAKRLASAATDEGWNARRVLRRAGVGTIEERRAKLVDRLDL